MFRVISGLPIFDNSKIMQNILITNFCIFLVFNWRHFRLKLLIKLECKNFTLIIVYDMVTMKVFMTFYKAVKLMGVGTLKWE